jgi:hypothetical protein
MRFLQELNNINPAKGKYLTVSIPAELAPIFQTDTCIIVPLKDGRGIAVLPAEVTLL